MRVGKTGIARLPRSGSVHPLTLLACPLSQPPGGQAIKLDLESATELQGFTGDDTYFYWSDGLGVWRVPKAAVAPVPVGATR